MAFGTAAQDSYIESQDTYTSLFADQAKSNAIMHVLGSVIYREMRQPDSTQKLLPFGKADHIAQPVVHNTLLAASPKKTLKDN